MGRNGHSNLPISSNGSKNGVAAVAPKAAIDVEGLLRADPVTSIDLASALKTTKPSSDGKMTKCVLSLERHAAAMCYAMLRLASEKECVSVMCREGISANHYSLSLLTLLLPLLPSIQVHSLAR